MLLIVRVHDKTHPDPVMAASLTKEGDVIDVLPDDALLGDRVLDNPDWRILLSPDMTQAEADQLLSRALYEMPALGEPAAPLPAARFWRLHLETLAEGLPPLRALLDDDARTVVSVTIPAADVMAAAFPTEPTPDPQVIG